MEKQNSNLGFLLKQCNLFEKDVTIRDQTNSRFHWEYGLCNFSDKENLFQEIKIELIPLSVSR